MEFVLPFSIAISQEKISYNNKIFFIGSCFSEEIAEHFGKLKFNVLQNPNGILYDPLSICYALNSYVENKKYGEQDLFISDDVWHSWHYHSVFSGVNKNAALEKINHSQSNANTFLNDASWLVITLGTAYNYQLKESKEFVANCHKVPSSSFEKKLMETAEIIAALSDTIKRIRSYNPKIKIILTISPVRHVRDGVIENNRSKARLIEATHSIIEANENVFYFPAYELVIDILRDYRFYKSDMVHTNEMAVQYVFENFCKTFMDDDTMKLMADIKALMNAKNHKPFHQESTAHKRFLKAQLLKVQEIINKNPALILTEELKYFARE